MLEGGPGQHAGEYLQASAYARHSQCAHPCTFNVFAEAQSYSDRLQGRGLPTLTPSPPLCAWA